MNFKEKVKRLNFLINKSTANAILTEDIYALQLINGLITQGNYLPLTSMSLRPYALAFICNELVINNREHVIEFGSGISTIVMGRLIKSERLKTQIVSIDENADWVHFMNQRIREENLVDIIRLIHAPLRPKREGPGRPHWYEEDYIIKHIGLDKYDMVVIDGPTAYHSDIAWS